MRNGMGGAVAVVLTLICAPHAAAQHAPQPGIERPGVLAARSLPAAALPAVGGKHANLQGQASAVTLATVPAPALSQIILPPDMALAQRSGARLSVAGGIGGFLVGGLAGGLAACHFNRDSYGVFCAGQNDTKLAIGAALGGAAGAALGAWLFRRSG